jgi:nitroimidazol reductase NimA-like FMN-containing flavoprotein (pyridoxamine 5'-phosphate oxidase superfamily)
MDQEPQGKRLVMPGGYERAEGDELLPWTFVEERLLRAENFWLATASPGGRPHVTPVWGAWVEGALYFDGIPTARWARNLAANPQMEAHLESGTKVVILEGTAEDLTTSAETAAKIVEAWTAKYGMLQPEPDTRGILRLRPRRVRAWSRFPNDATYWSLPQT